MSNLNPRSTTSNPVHILLVDDNRNGLMARKAVLAELGYRITTATRPTQALEAFRNDSFDLVITDYNMPEMKGIELIHHLRADCPAIPVILISGYAEALGLNESNTRADAVIQKSANEVSHLLLAVARLLKRKAPRKPANTQTSAYKSKRKSRGVS
jgi:CheY-like chemotaxis protein